MIVQAVDLAAVAWAYCVSSGGLPTFQTCAWYYPTEMTAVEAIVEPWRVWGPTSYNAVPDVVLVEDQPHGVRFDTTAKATARFQGRIIDRLELVGHKDRILFVPPALWQRHFDGVWRAGPKGAAEAALRYGYSPPNLLEIHASEIPLHGKERQVVRLRLKKLMTDYVDAYLISVWAFEMYAKHGTVDIKSTQRYMR